MIRQFLSKIFISVISLTMLFRYINPTQILIFIGSCINTKPQLQNGTCKSKKFEKIFDFCFAVHMWRKNYCSRYTLVRADICKHMCKYPPLRLFRIKFYICAMQMHNSVGTNHDSSVHRDEPPTRIISTYMCGEYVPAIVRRCYVLLRTYG